MATKTTDAAGGGQQGNGDGTTGGARKGTSAQKGASAKSAGGQKSGGAKSGGATAAGGQKSAGQQAEGAQAGAVGQTGGAKSAGAKSGGAKSGGAKSGGAKSGGSAGGSRGGRGASGSGTDLHADVRSFASTRPEGWNHEEWLGFLEDLRSRGHNIEDRDAIGSMLERERIGIALEKVPGLGPQRIRSIADRYGNLWRLKDVSAEELAREVNIPRPLAERVVESIR